VALLAEREVKHAEDDAPRSTAVDWVLMALVVLAAAVRFWNLRATGLWFDETVSAQVVRSGGLFHNVAHFEGTPPLYFMLLWAWTKAFGSGDAALRSLSAVSGTALVPLVYVTLRQLRLDRRTARIAALLVACNPLLVWFSREARAYSLYACLATATLLCAVRARRSLHTPDLVVWSVVSAAAIATQYFALSYVVAEAAWLAYALRPKLRQAIVVTSPILATGAFLLAFFVPEQRASGLQSWIPALPLTLRFAEAGRQAVMGPGGWDDRLWIVGALAAAVGALLIVKRSADDRRTAVALVTLAMVGVAIPYAAALAGFDYLNGRNMLPSLVFVIMALAVGLGARNAGRTGVAAVVVLTAVSALVVANVARDPALERTDWRALASSIDHGVPGASVIVLQHDGILGIPLHRYLRSSQRIYSGETVRTHEIDLVFHLPKHVERCGRFQGRDCDTGGVLQPQLPAELAAEFSPVGDVGGDRLFVRRYRAPHDVTVRIDQFSDDVGTSGTVMLARS
jgi:hypothetical protein